LKRALVLVFLFACSKKSAPSPCDVAVETRTAVAVPKVGATETESCEGGRPAVHRQIEDLHVEDDVAVYDEETTPLRPSEDGCEQAGPPQHVWHAVDTKTKKEWLFRADVSITVEPKAIVAKKAGCNEIRYSR
jgi:hypothetical protein